MTLHAFLSRSAIAFDSLLHACQDFLWDLLWGILHQELITTERPEVLVNKVRGVFLLVAIGQDILDLFISHFCSFISQFGFDNFFAFIFTPFGQLFFLSKEFIILGGNCTLIFFR